MNKTPSETTAFLDELKGKVADAGCEVIVCVPFVNLQNAVAATKGTNIKVGAENLHFEKSGAFTGEVSADMLTDLGVEYVVIGHSERRQYFNETNVTVNKKVLAALAAGLKPIICVGELLEEREQGITEEIVSLQTKIALMGVPADAMKDIVIAYEPVWAIGTGKTATATDANNTIGYIRHILAKKFHRSIAEKTRIQYGGSMNVKNCKELMAEEEIDGGLIGGASLKAEDFAYIVNYNK